MNAGYLLGLLVIYVKKKFVIFNTKEIKFLRERKTEQEKLEEIKVMEFLKQKAVCKNFENSIIIFILFCK